MKFGGQALAAAHPQPGGNLLNGQCRLPAQSRRHRQFARIELGLTPQVRFLPPQAFQLPADDGFRSAIRSKM